MSDSITPATYQSRIALVEHVLACFHRDRQSLLKHFRDEQEKGDYQDHIDFGIDVGGGWTWLVRWSIEEQRIIELFDMEPMTLENGMKTWLHLRITIPEELGGEPAGTLYAALMAQGCDLRTFERLMRLLEEAGRVRKCGHVYHLVRNEVLSKAP